MSEKLRVAFKRMDHIERAFRREEKSLLVKDFEQQQRVDRENYDKRVNEQKQAAKETHERNMQIKTRLSRVLPQYNKYKSELQAKIADKYKQAEADSKVAIEKEIEERKQKHEEKKRLEKEHEEAQKALAEAKEAEKAEAEEVERKKREALETDKARRDEELAKRKAEREEERRKTDEIVRRQREREEEADRRQREESYKNTGSVWGSKPTKPMTWVERKRAAEGKSAPTATSAPPPPNSRGPRRGDEKPSAFSSMKKRT